MIQDSPLLDMRPKNPLEVSPLVENFIIVPQAGGGIPEAPVDNYLYGRINATWARAVPLAGGAMTGPLILSQDPVAALGAVTKEYADATIMGLQVKPTARVATAAALPANVYNNGTAGVGATLTGSAIGVLTVDGVATALNDVVLVKNETAAANNGLYQVTTAGSASVAYVLTRHTAQNTPASFAGAFTAVSAGTAGAGTLWLCNPIGTVTIGTTAIPWTQLNSPVTLTAGNGISIAANTVSAVGVANQITVGAGGIGISSGYAGQGSIVNVGTLVTGSIPNTLVTGLGTMSTVADAPATGGPYGRQSNAWVAVTGGGGAPPASTNLPLMDGTAAAGVATPYSREDHVHPSDTSRAPIASPTFTGTVTVPTAVAGTSSGVAASTSFVGTAVANGLGTLAPIPAPSSTTPAMDGTAAIGAGTTYARADHVHPSDISRAALTGAAFTGAVTVPTPAANDNTTNAATTAYVIGQASSATPAMDGTAAAGTATTFARADHVHPSDTSRAPIASPTFTGTPAAPTPAVNTSTTQLATTAFVLGQVSSTTPLADSGSGAVGTGTTFARADHVHPAATPPGAVVAINFYTSSQTVTIPAGATKGFVQMWGATGGSGSTNNTTSAGTAAGGYLEKYLTGLTAGNTLIYTQGAGGAAGAAASAGTVTTGGNATTTTLTSGTQTIAALTCTGSTGSAVFNGATQSTPGTASGGDINVTGQVCQINGNPAGMAGGSNFYSLGANGVGGSGAITGNAGNSGGLKITWYA